MKAGRWWDVLRMRFRSLAKRQRVETELDKELRYHIEQQTEENIAAGMNPREAREAASRTFGGVSQIEEECRDMRQTQYLDNLLQDLRYAMRMLGKSPAFTVVIVLTLALSIGANSAIFSVIDGVLLKPLPYPQAERIARVFYRSASYPKFPVNPWDFLDFRARNRSFENFAMYTHADVQLSGMGSDPVKLSAFRISSGYFRLLGVQPARGREFDFSEERPGNGNVVILSDRVWRNQFGAATDILGRKVLLDSQPYTVVGVMPAGVDHPGNSYNSVAYGDTVDAWTPFTFDGNPNSRGSHYVEGIGRLKPGLTAEQAAADFNGIMTELASQHEGDKGWTIYMVPIFQEIVGPVHKMLLVLLGAVGLVLLIACVNAANLLLARAVARQREIAMRAALGASRGRLVRQMLAESLLISVFGGALGALLAIVGVRVLVAFLPTGFPRLDAIHVNGVVFGFTAAIALATGLIFGLVPAVQASRTDPQRGLRDGGRGSSGSGRQTKLRAALVVGEVGLACLLLVGAGVLLRSFVNLLKTDPGFRPERVLTAEIALPNATYKEKTAVADFYTRMLTNLSALPGTRSVGAGTDLPWTGYDENMGGFTIEGKTPPPNDEFHARYHTASPDYFRAVGIPLVRGRFFDERDNKDSQRTMIINDVMARRYWQGEDVIGKRITFDDKPKESDWFTVVGVVGDVKDKPESAGAEPAFWWPLMQQPFAFRSMTIALRANTDPTLLAESVRNVVRALDPSLAVANVKLMDKIADENFSIPRFALFLVGLFAGLALVLSAIGIYGVISYSVSQRMHEFGMRVALGASSWNLIKMVMKQGVLLTVIGVGIGLGCALALAGVLDSLLYGVSARDPLTLLGVAAMALVTATLASLPSARRATGADPITSLRAE
ncbi:MAG TPA: ABC transporter permease [Candidatus Sulfotelmatobacter sp.]|nr:ABC transporter permease [Candidatus Sulfotelmatobacter sp.]